MKITGIETFVLSYRYDTAIADAQNYFSTRNAVLLRIATDEGLVGIGEAACFGGPPSTTTHMIEHELAPMLIGRDPTNIERLWRMMFDRTRQHGRGGVVMCAMSGVDIALWDILGKKAGLPLYKLLGGYADKLVPYASSGFYTGENDIQALGEAMDGYFRQGFRYAKMKVGRDPDEFQSPLSHLVDGDKYNHSHERDLERVAACCRVAEKYGAKIMVDANCSWNTYTAIRMGRELEKMGVFWLEEPLALDNVDGSAEVCAALALPVAGYETETGKFRFREYIDKQAVDIVQPDAIWSGGITECRKIAHYAEAHCLPVMPHAFSSAVSLAANAHLLASLGNGGILEMDRNVYPLRTDLLTESLDIAPDGFVHLPQGPGLGIELRDDTVEKYRVG